MKNFPLLYCIVICLAMLLFAGCGDNFIFSDGPLPEVPPVPISVADESGDTSQQEESSTAGTSATSNLNADN
jgi:hypothetical protein